MSTFLRKLGSRGEEVTAPIERRPQQPTQEMQSPPSTGMIHSVTVHAYSVPLLDNYHN